jgi:hypothetical protein
MAGFEEVREDNKVVPHPAAPKGQQIATDALLLAIKALSQRFIIALSSLFALLVIGSVWWLFLSIEQNPSVNQLVGLGGYAMFVLAAIWIVRRK